MNFFFFVSLNIYLFFFVILISTCKTANTDILSIFLYKNEICSYNGVPTINNSIILCECYSSFVDEPRKQFVKYVEGQKIQCSYQRKRRLISFILASLLPIGLDYLYLEHYGYFFLILILDSLLFFSILYEIFLSNKLKDILHGNIKSKYCNESNHKNSFLKITKNIENNERMLKILKMHRSANKILIIALIIYWVIDVTLQYKGVIKDKNGVETENNLNSLFLKDED